MFNFSRDKIRNSLAKTRNSVFGQITDLFGGGDIDDELWDDLEALLIQADVGVETTLELIEQVRQRVRVEGVTNAADAQRILQDEMRKLLEGFPPSEVASISTTPRDAITSRFA